jgi:hypothetical protein
MPKDKALKAKAINDKDVPLADIGRAGKKSSAKVLTQIKDPIAMPPFTSGIVGAANAIASAGSSAVSGGQEANSNNPKAKSLISINEEDLGLVNSAPVEA